MKTETALPDYVPDEWPMIQVEPARLRAVWSWGLECPKPCEYVFDIDRQEWHHIARYRVAGGLRSYCGLDFRRVDDGTAAEVLAGAPRTVHRCDVCAQVKPNGCHTPPTRLPPARLILMIERISGNEYL